MHGTLYSAHTRKAVENFPISGQPMPAAFIRALALVKKHAAIVNGQLGEIPKGHARAIAKAADAISAGGHLDQFPVDVFQTGSGTSSNMNMNEVLATLANEIQGIKRIKRTKGIKGNEIHPNDHVNRCQSSNDVIPTALRIACALKARDEMFPALLHLEHTLSGKGRQFRGIVKTGRTHLMDAVPVRLGDEFASYASLIGRSRAGAFVACLRLHELPLGGTAAGTGLNANPQFARRAVAALGRETGLPLREASNHMAVQSCPLALLGLSAALREIAVALAKIAGDIRLMASGPSAGLGELRLPGLQPGSSIMPGKTNPVLCESVEQVAARITGADAAVAACVGLGSRFELNTCLPLAASELLTAMDLLTAVSRAFADKCVSGIEANADVMADRLARSAMLATALVPHVGYDEAARIAREAQRTGETVMEVALRRTRIPKRELARILDPRMMA